MPNSDTRETAETYRKLANDCRVLAHRELNMRQLVMLWMAVGAWEVVTGRREQMREARASAAKA
jgi:hypothetical protein